jgi:hypothetical protein
LPQYFGNFALIGRDTRLIPETDQPTQRAANAFQILKNEVTMLNKKFTAAALTAAMMLPGAASAASKSSTMTVRLTVSPIILLFVTDNTMEMTANDINEDNLDATGKTRAEGRAQFFVAANTGYSINLAPDETWGAADAEKVKFVGTATPANYIAGELFLDTDISSDARTAGDADIIGWDATDGDVSHSNASRGVRRYGVGAVFNPQDWSGNGTDDLAGAPAGSLSIAPPDVYSTTVTVTVSNI